MEDIAFMKFPECHKSSPTDAEKTSSAKDMITQRTLRHVLYDRNPVRVVNVDDTHTENVDEKLGEVTTLHDGSSWAII